MPEPVKPIIFWEGFPPCGLLIKLFADEFAHDIKILGTKALVPFADLEKYLGHPIRWLKHPDEIWDIREEYQDRNLIIHTGWRHAGWLRFDRWMRHSKGAKVVVTLDNIYRGEIRQYIGAMLFRLWFKHHFDAALVPGRASARFLRFLGMPDDKIFYGNYGASELLYKPGPKVSMRTKEFLYVGQLIYRKSIDVMLEAFRIYRKTGGTWDLRLLGEGPLAKQCCGNGIIYEGFGQPEHCATRMRQARCLLLISREEHWGTVVCEAAASGALLIASKGVGSAEDIIRHGINGLILNQIDPKRLSCLMHEISSWDDARLDIAGSISVGIAQGFNSSAYMFGVKSIISAINDQ